jgi:hypothetical protein
MPNTPDEHVRLLTQLSQAEAWYLEAPPESFESAQERYEEALRQFNRSPDEASSLT